MATREQDVVNRMYEALNAHDPDDLARYFSEDCEVVAPPGELRGREAVRLLAQTYWSAFSDLKWRTVGQYASGESVVTEEVLEGTNDGDLVPRGLPAGLGGATPDPGVRGCPSARRRDRVTSPVLGQRCFPARRRRDGTAADLRRAPGTVAIRYGIQGRCA